MTGAGYGAFDLEWIINTLRIGEVNGDTEVGIDYNKGFSIAEDFIMGRYYMYTNVYFHKTTRSAELIIDKIFERASKLEEEGKIDLPDDLLEILKKGLCKECVKNYINLTDNTIWHYICLWTNSEDIILKDLCDRLLNHRFFKVVKIENQNIFDFVSDTQRIYKENNLPIEYYLLRDEATSSTYKDPYIFQTPKSEGKENEREASEQIFLFDEKGNNKELSDVSDLIRQIRNKNIQIERFYVPEEIKCILTRR